MFVQEGGGDRLIPRANSIDIQFRLVLGDRRLRRDVAFITAAPLIPWLRNTADQWRGLRWYFAMIPRFVEGGSMVEKWRIRRVMRKERHESISFDPSSRDKPVTGLECPETRGEGQEHRERRKCKYIYICMYPLHHQYSTFMQLCTQHFRRHLFSFFF